MARANSVLEQLDRVDVLSLHAVRYGYVQRPFYSLAVMYSYYRPTTTVVNRMKLLSLLKDR